MGKKLYFIIALSLVFIILLTWYLLRQFSTPSSVVNFPEPTVKQKTVLIPTSSLNNNLLIMEQQKQSSPYGIFSRVLLQNLTVKEYYIDQEKLFLTLIYQKNGEGHLLKLEARNRFGDENGLKKIAPDFNDNYFTSGDKINITLDYKSSADNITSQSIKQYFLSKENSNIEEQKALFSYLGNFGDTIIDIEDIKSRLDQPSAEFKHGEVIVTSIDKK